MSVFLTIAAAPSLYFLNQDDPYHTIIALENKNPDPNTFLKTANQTWDSRFKAMLLKLPCFFPELRENSWNVAISFQAQTMFYIFVDIIIGI